MKEFIINFATKHPILTFLTADAAICGAVNIVKAVAGIFSRPTEVTVETKANADIEIEEEDDDEPAGDIQ